MTEHTHADDLMHSARVALAGIQSIPDVTRYNPDPKYLRGLLLLAGLSQRRAADALGITDRMMRYYLAYDANVQRLAPYPVQYALEQLARTGLEKFKHTKEKQCT